MRILLINPPRSPENAILANAPEEAKRFIHKKLIGPPLGLLTIASAVKDHDVLFIDLKGEYDLVPDSPPLKVLVKKYVEEFKPDIVGSTFIASELYAGIEIFRTTKAVNPEIITVAGGLHCTLCPEDFTDESVDFICPGQSAGMFRELVIALEQGTDSFLVAGLIVNGKDGSHVSPLNPALSWNAARENFYMPDRRHLKRWISTYHVGGHPSPSTYIFTSLGCPYRCSFCSIWKQYCGEFMQRNIESIIEELKQIPEYDVVRFADANTIVNTAFIDKLFERIAEEGIKKEYIMDIRFDTAVQYPDLIAKLARCGLRVVICGFESFREEELKKYHKGSSAKLIELAIEVFHDNNVQLRGNYVVPPDYMLDDFKALSDYASAHRVVYAGYTILSPMPGTDYYDEVKDQIIDHNLSKYNFFNCVLPTKMPLEEFYKQVGSLWLIKKGTDVI
jgi:hopanoid C-3 methylase